jgi:hypothetical protein
MKAKLTFGLTILYLLSCFASASISIGAGPSTLDFGKLTKGGYAENQITVSTAHDKDLQCTVEYAGDLKGWVSLDSGNEFVLKANSRKDVRVVIMPPLDVQNGKYEGAIYIKAAPQTTITQGAGLAVGAGVRIGLSAEITGQEDVSIEVKNAVVGDTEVGYPIKVSLDAENTGNIRYTPRFQVDVFDMSGKKFLSGEYSDTPLLPTRIERIRFTLPSGNLPIGEYKAEINTYVQDNLLDNQAVVFKILPEGSWSIAGKLEKIILSANNVEADELVKVSATFKNTGQVPVKAKLKAEAYMGTKLVSALPESDEMGVEPGQKAKLETYFTPKKAGDYLIKAVAVFGGSQTESKKALLTVSEAEPEAGYSMYLIGGIILAVLVYILFFRGRGQQQYYSPYQPGGGYQQGYDSQYQYPTEDQQYPGYSPQENQKNPPQGGGQDYPENPPQP